MRTIQSELKRVEITKKRSPAGQGKSSPSTELKKELSKREIEELMGTRRPTYRKHRGAFRSK